MRALTLLIVMVVAACGPDGGGSREPADNPCDLPVECPDEPGVRYTEHPEGAWIGCERHNEAINRWVLDAPARTNADFGDGLVPSSWTDNATLSRSCIDGALAWEAVGTGTPESFCVSFCDTDLVSQSLCEGLPYPPCE